MSKTRVQRRLPGIGQVRGQKGMSPPEAQNETVELRGSSNATTRNDLEVAPFNARRLDEARNEWALGNWKEITQTRLESVSTHPERGALAIVHAAALIQLGDRAGAREHASLAFEWNCDREFMARVLVASARNSVGRASAVAKRVDPARQHFQQSLFDRRNSSEARRVAQARLDDVAAELVARREIVAGERKAGPEASGRSRNVWISDLVGRCIAASDMHEAVDGVLERLLAMPDDRIQFLLKLSDHFLSRRDKLVAVHYLNTAREYANGASETARKALTAQLVAAGQPSSAMDMLFDDAMTGLEKEPNGVALTKPIRQAYKTVREAEKAKREHGHELLLSYLKIHGSKFRSKENSRQLSMVEIGTTREIVPGQGSTRTLAEYCDEQGIDFVTVDMDPHNGRMARKVFDSLGTNFQALTSKGEDYLRQRQDPIDFIFLDAYDYDHGQHSELRQSRYIKFLGSRIDEQACHQMHLDCAESLVRLMVPKGLICIDDTWIEDEAWTAKGTLAMPYLLQNGFELVDARNRAALLRRVASINEG